MTTPQQSPGEKQEPEQSRPPAERSGSSQVPEFCRKPLLILGCGNVLFGDDGFGPAVIEHLRTQYEIPDAVCALDVGTGVRSLLFTILISPELPKQILLIDAIDRGGPPGQIFEVEPGDLPPEKAEGFSLHQAPSSNLAIELMRASVEVRVLVAQTDHIPESVEPGLSNALREAVPRMCERIVREFLYGMNTWLHENGVDA